MSAVAVIDAYVAALPGETRVLAPGEWGISVGAEQAGGGPIDVGMRLADGLLRAQAFAVDAGSAPDPGLLLAWNRQTRLVRYASTRAGDIWVVGDVPAAAIDGERAVDRLLGLLVEAVVAARWASRGGGEPLPESGGWLSPASPSS
jgi:hypothetical protein